MMANVAAWDRLDAFGARGQAAFNALKYAPFPVIGAPSGRALGGGCEVLLHCDAVQAHTETYMGLVELGVGLLPAWGGCKELLQRAAARGPGGPMAAAAQAFEVIAAASVSTSAQHAQELGYLRPTDRITPNRDRLLADASRSRAGAGGRLRAARAAAADRGRRVRPGNAGADSRAASPDAGRQRIRPRAGRPLRVGADRRRRGRPRRAGARERDLGLELEAIGGLIRRPQTIERIGHMLATGKPLRN